MIRILLITLLPACLASAEEPLTLPGQEEAWEAVQTEIFNAYGEVPPTPKDGPVVTWVDEKCPYEPESNAVVVDGVCYHGLTYSPYEIYVALDEANPDSICSTELVHELGHVARLQLAWDGDAKHSDKDFWSLEANLVSFICENYP